jgi:hypothetical protein
VVVLEVRDHIVFTARSSKSVLCLIGIELGLDRRKLDFFGRILCVADKLGGTLDEPNILGLRGLKRLFELHLVPLS